MVEFIIFWEVIMANLGGRPVAFETPEEFELKAMDYIQWVKNNPVMKTITASFQGEITYDKVPHTRGMTQFGLAAHMGIGLRTLHDYKKKPEFSHIYDEVMTIIKSWNADLALTGEINQALVARLDGHVDSTDITTNGEPINKQSLDVSKLTDEQLRSLDSIISQASQSGTSEKESD
jgi:hypothetical protein